MNDSQPCEFLEWDTAFFGVRTAKATDNTLTAAGTEGILRWCRDNCIDALYFLCPANDNTTRRHAQQAGFHLVDIRLTLEHGFKTSHFPQAPDAVSHDIRELGKDDLPALRTLAAVSHRNTRFYNDPFYPRAACDRFYAAWIERSCAGYDDKVWVLEDSSGIAGYATARIREGAGAMGLVAVSEQARGKGAGSALVRRSLAWFREEGARSAKVVTQGSDVPAQRMYQRAGFVTSRVELWYHWHPRAEDVRGATSGDKA